MLPSTITIGYPLARFARVVQVEHGGNGIDPQPVNMVLTQPEQGTGEQEIAHLGTAIIKDVGAPFLMFAFARVRVFVEVGTIKIAQSKAVFGKVRGHPVEQDTDALLMQVIHKVLKIFRGAIATGRSKVSCHLIPP